MLELAYKHPRTGKQAVRIVRAQSFNLNASGRSVVRSGVMSSGMLQHRYS